MKYTPKDFTLNTLPTEAKDRALQFRKWLEQSEKNDHEIYWLAAESAVKPEMKIFDKSTKKIADVISFISNDYLGMSQRLETIEAGIEGIRKYGTGVCAAPIIGGYLGVNEQLEKQLAEFTGQEDALIFSSGFGVNVGVLNALLGKEDVAFIDLQVHSSVLDGLHKTNVRRTGHNDLEYLEIKLKSERHKFKTAMVIIDGVYSQDGDIAPLPEIIALCKQYDVLLLLDDAHGIGVFGENGRGVAEHFNVLGQVDFITGTLSKSFGAVGGFVACSKDMVNYFKYHANTAVFSASPTPQVTFSVTKALELIKTDTSPIQRLWNNTHYLRKRLTEENFDIGHSVAPIFPIMVRDPYKVLEITRLLKERGIYAIGITFPAVTNKDSRVRVSLSAAHEVKHLDALVEALCEIDKIIKIRVN